MSNVIVDAKSEAVTRPNDTMSVPVRLDTAGLVAAIQAATSEQEMQETRVNPAEMIKNSAAKMVDLYERFNALKALGTAFHGKSFSEPLPANVRIDKITVDYAIIDADKVTPTSAVIQNVICIGDLANLLSSEMGLLILQLEQESAAIKNTAQRTEETAVRAKENWQKSNPDRMIVSDENGVGIMTPTDPAAVRAAAAEQPTVTLKDETKAV